MTDFYDLEPKVEPKRKKKILVDKLDHSIKISLYKFILGKMIFF